MTSSSPAPKLPLWIFIATDVALLAAAAFIAGQSTRPLPEATTFAIVACIIAGAVIGLVPLVIYYERTKNEFLDERQRALEALARTVHSSAEQISIAAGGLHEMAELSQRNLRQAEQLPHKLQEKIAEFQAQLTNANDIEKEELEKELEELRAGESERLQSISDRIAKTATDLTKLEAATQQHVTAANEALAKLAAGTTAAIGKAQSAAEQALARAGVDASRSVAESTAAAVKAIDGASAAALVDLNAQFDSAFFRIKDVTRQLSEAVDSLRAAGTVAMRIQPSAVMAPAPAPAPEAPAHDQTPAPQVAPSPAETPVAVADIPKAEEPVAPEAAPAPAPAKRARKPRREEGEPNGAVAEAAPASEPVNGISHAGQSPVSVVEPQAVQEEPSAPTPAVAETAASIPAPEAHVQPSAAAPADAAPAEPVKPTRKRGARKIDDDQPALGLDLEEPNGNAGESGIVERVLTSDGATRLIVTAYIGIGNRLFIRGNGPGLSWEKGVPLQFVSIGKWRWETNDASGPVQFKLLKNDEHESSVLGELTIDPGHQHEVTVNFNS